MKPRQRSLGPWDSREPVRRSRHGLSADEVTALVTLQGGGCAVCHRTDQPLQLDHDHRHCPGTYGCRQCVRGALCGNCNNALKLLRDDRTIVAELGLYLERTQP